MSVLRIADASTPSAVAAAGTDGMGESDENDSTG
jgi:hypothetical protein